MQHMGVVPEVQTGQLQLAPALGIDLVGTVDQNVRDGRVVQQRLDRAEPDHLVDDADGEPVLLVLVQEQLALACDQRHQRIDEDHQLAPVHAHRLERLDAQENLVADGVRGLGRHTARGFGRRFLGRWRGWL